MFRDSFGNTLISFPFKEFAYEKGSPCQRGAFLLQILRDFSDHKTALNSEGLFLFVSQVLVCGKVSLAKFLQVFPAEVDGVTIPGLLIIGAQICCFHKAPPASRATARITSMI